MAEPLFDVSGQWKAVQSNGYTVNFNLSQDNDGLITGVEPSASSGPTSGVVEEGGRVDGNSFTLTVNWTGPGRGEYSGTFSPTGRLHGITIDLNNPGSHAFWYSDIGFPRF
jgi:hypothetical protein